VQIGRRAVIGDPFGTLVVGLPTKYTVGKGAGEASLQEASFEGSPQMPVEASLSLLDENTLLRQLEQSLLDVCKRLVALCRREGADAVELQDKFLPAVADIHKVFIGPLDPKMGSFSQERGVLLLKEEPVVALMRFVLADIRSKMREGHHLASAEIPLLLERALADYMLHELRHESQGVGKYQDFLVAKEIAGADVMSDIDVQADRDAAFAYGKIYGNDNDRASYLECFREALFLSSSYYFNVFNFASRPDKRNRAVAVMMMIARVADIKDFSAISERRDLPLDAPLFVRTKQSSLAIVHGFPTGRFLGAANDADVGQLISQVDRAQFEEAVQTSVLLAKRLGLL